MVKDVQDRHTEVRRGFRTPALRATCRVGSFVFRRRACGSSAAFANWDGGAEHSDDWNADHDGIYQVQRGDLICEFARGLRGRGGHSDEPARILVSARRHVAGLSSGRSAGSAKAALDEQEPERWKPGLQNIMRRR